MFETECEQAQAIGGLPKLGKGPELPPLGLGKLGQAPPIPAPLSRREPLTAEDIASHPNIAQLSEDMAKEREQLAVGLVCLITPCRAWITFPRCDVVVNGSSLLHSTNKRNERYDGLDIRLFVQSSLSTLFLCAVVMVLLIEPAERIRSCQAVRCRLQFSRDP